MRPPWIQRPPTVNEWEIQLLKSLPDSQLTLIHQPFASPNYCLCLPRFPNETAQSPFGFVFAATTVKSSVTLSLCKEDR